MGLLAYYAGHSATGTVALFGVAGLVGTLALPGLLLARRKRGAADPPLPDPGPPAVRSAGPSDPGEATRHGDAAHEPKLPSLR